VLTARTSGRRALSLAAKLALTMTILVVMAVASVTLISLYGMQQDFQADLEQQAELLLDALAAAAADSLYTLDTDGLTDLIKRLGEHQAVLLSSRVYDSQGRVIVDAADAARAFQLESDPFGLRLIASRETVFEWRADRLVAGQAVLVGRERAGAVSVELATAALQVKLDTIRAVAIAIGVVIGIVGALLALLLSRSITTPLRALTSATERVAGGDLTHRIAVRSRDELATLALAFNGMTERLQEMLAHQEGQRAALAAAKERLERSLAEIGAAHEHQQRLVQTIRGLSTPVLSIAERVLLVPLIGALDSDRSRQLMEEMLEAIGQRAARVAILDITGVPMIDTQVAGALLQAAGAAKLMGARVVVCGITPEVAQAITSLGLDLRLLITAGDLQTGLRLALAIAGVTAPAASVRAA
jgi:anti-anti-sigma factor